jgi:hypothetical protein
MIGGWILVSGMKLPKRKRVGDIVESLSTTHRCVSYSYSSMKEVFLSMIRPQPNEFVFVFDSSDFDHTSKLVHTMPLLVAALF